jgi:hypothetical protein
VRLKHLLMATAVFLLGNALITLPMPAVQLSLYGVADGAAARYMAQWAGLGSFAVGLVALMARSVADRHAQRAVGVALLAYYVVGAGLSVLGTLTGVMTPWGWSLVVLYLLFAAGYVTVLLRSPGVGWEAGLRPAP